jgi:hypothetical protein
MDQRGDLIAVTTMLGQRIIGAARDRGSERAGRDIRYREHAAEQERAC